MSNLSACALCPRACGMDRTAGQRGRCHETATVRIARASLHMWEEPCLSGDRGSGTVFFTGCPLGCVFCQNYNIADGTNGAEVTPEELTDVFLKLEDMGAHNINLVTPTHFVPAIVPVLERAKGRGLKLPVVYNTGTYETVETIRMLDGLVDIWLPDFKYVSPELAARYSFAPDYFDVASAALKEMARQTHEAQRRDTWVPDLCAFDLDGMMTRASSSGTSSCRAAQRTLKRSSGTSGTPTETTSISVSWTSTHRCRGSPPWPAGSTKNWTGG